MAPPNPLSTEQALLADAEALEAQTEDLGEDVDEIAEALAVHSIVSEERHDEIIEGVTQCQNRLENLSATIQQQGTAESPLLAQVLTNLAEIRAELKSLKSSMDTMQLTPTTSLRSEASPPEPQEITPPDTSLTEHPASGAEESPVPPTPQKRPRFHRL